MFRKKSLIQSEMNVKRQWFTKNGLKCGIIHHWSNLRPSSACPLPPNSFDQTRNRLNSQATEGSVNCAQVQDKPPFDNYRETIVNFPPDEMSHMKLTKHERLDLSVTLPHVQHDRLANRDQGRRKEAGSRGAEGAAAPPPGGRLKLQGKSLTLLKFIFSGMLKSVVRTYTVYKHGCCSKPPFAFLK